MIDKAEDHNKSKLFNCYRQRMCFVEKQGSKKTIELWILVFPSKQYVDQIAELVKAIVDDFVQIESPKVIGSVVNVTHFPNLENSITEWTGFDDFISLYVRHGDVVVVGNIELLIQGIKDFSFSISDHSYEFGGINNMFGVCVALNNHTKVRMILVGIKESFWGDASAQYVESILKMGATHILYGSKAATTITNEDIHSTYAPEHFSLVDGSGSYSNIEYQRGNIGKFIENLGVQTTGFAITVPTVIGESHEQRESIKNVGPTCMDCENGHIALRVSKLNQYFNNEASRLTDASFQKKFIPIHFITDYIYNTTETVDSSLGNLSVHASEINQEAQVYLKNRNDSFRKLETFWCICFNIWEEKSRDHCQ
ncbi:MAG: hypothetical protein IPN13_22225 [Bacteroidetes bacterium]|nr:hypothetical protein [Bacteroidota bacterium]